MKRLLIGEDGIFKSDTKIGAMKAKWELEQKMVEVIK